MWVLGWGMYQFKGVDGVMKKDTKYWTWKCPACKGINTWKWDLYEVPKCNDVITLECSHCKVKTKMQCKMKRVKE